MPSAPIPPLQTGRQRIRGRGSATNASGRYEATQREDCDDGWAPEGETLPALRTEVTRDSSRTIITRNTSPDIAFDRSINPYRGCEHGCIYCFARPTHAYLGLSPGLDFESRLFVKPDAAHLLTKELGHPRYRPKTIAIGTNTDPYQPIEKSHRIMRAVLEVLAAHNHPVTIVTKSALVTRDIDILAPMAAKNLTRVGISITTLDPRLARAMEPRASTPARRLGAITALAEAGVPVRVMAAPMIPGLTDHELDTILEAAAKAGATRAAYILLRMPLEIKDLFREWLKRTQPDRAKRVISLLQQMRGGKDYDPEWGKRMTGEGPVADLLARRFLLTTRRLGLTGPEAPLDCSQFAPPRPADAQLSLL